MKHSDVATLMIPCPFCNSWYPRLLRMFGRGKVVFCMCQPTGEVRFDWAKNDDFLDDTIRIRKDDIT